MIPFQSQPIVLPNEADAATTAKAEEICIAQEPANSVHEAA
jgi:hypothetical protein